jgi:hypothetical protein
MIREQVLPQPVQAACADPSLRSGQALKVGVTFTLPKEVQGFVENTGSCRVHPEFIPRPLTLPRDGAKVGS